MLCCIDTNLNKLQRKNSKIKIAFVVNSLGYSGAEKYVVDIANHIDKTRFETIIVCLKNNGPLSKQLAQNSSIYELNKREGNDLTLPFRLAKLLRKDRIDIVHSNNWGTYVESVIGGLLAKVPVMIHTQHGMEMNETVSILKRFLRNKIRKLTSHFTDRVVVVSKATSDFVVDGWQAPANKVTLIYNGVDLNKFTNANGSMDSKKNKTALGFSEDDIVIGSIGRLSSVKNYPYLVNAFHRISQAYPNTKLLLIGDGPDRVTIDCLIEKYNLTDKIILTGTMPDVRAHLQAMDIFVLPSISEGISLAVLEAMASSIPVIVTKVGGNPEIVENGKNGLLVSHRDSCQLQRALITLIKDHNKRKELGSAARQKVEDVFALDRMLKEYQTLYLSSIYKKGIEINGDF